MIQHNKKTYANSILLLAIAACILLIGCGTKPPAAYWTWSTQDSTDIQTIVDQWRGTFTDSMENNFYPLTYQSDTLNKILYVDIRNIWMRPHYWPREFKRVLSTFTVTDSFIVVKDTTVTVKLITDYDGEVEIHCDSATLRDPLRPDTVVGVDTFALYSRRLYYAPETTFANHFSGKGYRYLHFDKKGPNNTWQLSKISGGARIFVPSENDAPYLALCSLRTRTKSYGIQLRPDTLTYGIQRMYELDSMMTFPPTETITTRVLTFDPIVTFGFFHYQGRRYDLTAIANNTFQTTYPISLTAGWTHVMIELASWEGICKRGNYNAIFWSLPINIVP
jgi:hypothetical protein